MWSSCFCPSHSVNQFKCHWSVPASLVTTLLETLSSFFTLVWSILITHLPRATHWDGCWECKHWELSPCPKEDIKAVGRQPGRQQARNIVENCERGKHLNLLGVRETSKRGNSWAVFKKKQGVYPLGNVKVTKNSMGWSGGLAWAEGGRGCGERQEMVWVVWQGS